MATVTEDGRWRTVFAMSMSPRSVSSLQLYHESLGARGHPFKLNKYAVHTNNTSTHTHKLHMYTHTETRIYIYIQVCFQCVHVIYKSKFLPIISCPW